MTNTIIYLIGFAGVGKYTVARAVSEKRDVKIVDNHYILNPIFKLIEQDGVTPLPKEVWTQAGRVRQAVLTTIRTLSPADWNFVFTNELANGDSDSQMVYSSVVEVAQQRGATLVPVRLVCDTDELCQRVQTPQRRERMKGVDPKEARVKSETCTVLETLHPNELTLDVTRLQPAQAAAKVLERVDSLVGG